MNFSEKSKTLSTQGHYPWRTFLTAGVVACLIIAVNITFLPKGFMGFYTNEQNKIIYITPELIQEGANLRMDDQVLMIYNLPVKQVFDRWNFFDLIPSIGTPVPLIIERAGVIHTLEITQHPPSSQFQFGKVINIILSLCCLITGITLGKRAQYEGLVPLGIDIFWFGISAVVGMHGFAAHASVRFVITLEWVLVAILMPYFVIMHTFFPYRPQASITIIHSQRWLLSVFICLNSIIVGVIILMNPPLALLAVMLNLLLSGVVLLGFIGASVVLYRSYRNTTITHIRRQMRVLISTYLSVSVIWFSIFTLPAALSDEAFPSQLSHLVTIAIPLAHLGGGIFPDLYRLDRILLRIFSYLLTLATLLFLSGIMVDIFDVNHGVILWMGFYTVIPFYPTLSTFRRIFPILGTYSPHHALYCAIDSLKTTLDFQELTAVIIKGIATTFQRPALGIYLRPTVDSTLLTCIYNDRMPDLPLSLSQGPLLTIINENPVIESSAAIRSRYPHQQTLDDAASIVYHAQVSLWCPVHHPQHGLLGFIVLGRRGDLDPYRIEDIRELHRLFTAAALAYAHSYMYTQRVQAEQTIREIFIALQRAQDETAKAIARELHDEIINMNIRLNIEALQELMQLIDNPIIRNELDLILESEKGTARALRMVCDSIHPSGVDDPLGLTMILRGEIEKLEISYKGTLTFQVKHSPCPVAPTAQRELMRITGEAIVNAIKHANATEICVYLTYPATGEKQLKIKIQDNGRGGQVVQERPGHWGLRAMQERARGIGATIQWQTVPYQGTTVEISLLVADDAISHEQRPYTMPSALLDAGKRVIPA